MRTKWIRIIAGIWIIAACASAPLRAAAPGFAGQLGVSLTEDYRRVLTPNNDGYNDEAYFSLNNPGDVSVSGKIYDAVSGKVADMRVETTFNSQALVWDGRDAGGSVLPQGIYFYVISGGDSVLKGVIVIAK